MQYVSKVRVVRWKRVEICFKIDRTTRVFDDATRAVRGGGGDSLVGLEFEYTCRLSFCSKLKHFRLDTVNTDNWIENNRSRQTRDA